MEACPARRIVGSGRYRIAPSPVFGASDGPLLTPLAVYGSPDRHAGTSEDRLFGPSARPAGRIAGTSSSAAASAGSGARSGSSTHRKGGAFDNSKGIGREEVRFRTQSVRDLARATKYSMALSTGWGTDGAWPGDLALG